MIERREDMWEVSCDVICITTNGTIKKDGSCVMGRGCALQAREKFPGIDKKLGDLIKQNGNKVQVITNNGRCIVVFPVKHNWNELANHDLIEKSTKQLVDLTNLCGWATVVLPRPGCNNGGLSWENVKPILLKYLDDRFIIVNR